MKFNERDFEVLECLFYSKDFERKRIKIHSMLLLDLCKLLHKEDGTSKNFNVHTYKSLKKMISLGILYPILNDVEIRRGKKYTKYGFNRIQLVDIWKTSPFYSISQGILLLDGDVPKSLKRKIIEEYSKGKFILDTERWWSTEDL